MLIAGWVCFFLSCQSAVAQSPDENHNTKRSGPDIYLDLSLGAEYDSNVTINDIDLASNLNDVAFIFKAKAGVKHRSKNKVTTKASYTFLDKKYDELSPFDQRVHFGNLDISKRFERTTIGVTGRYLEAKLDGQSYVEVVQFSPYVAHYFGTKYFARMHYTFGDKTYKFRPERDGGVHAIGLDGYYFLNGTRQFISTGYRFKSVGAYEKQLAYDSHRLTAKYTQKIKLGSRDTTVSIYGRYERRKYDDFNFAVGDIREDNRVRVGLSWKAPLPANAYIKFDLNLSDIDSNLAIVDHSKTVTGLTLGKVF